MEQTKKKPKLVFFQWDHSNLPNFMKLHVELHAKCLAEFFDLVLINKDCDYAQICDTYQPDLTMFEGGYKSSFSRKITIKNTAANLEIPKLGLHNGDPWCDCRPGFISEMEHWGIDTFFSISTTAAEHTPEIADNLYVWPNFIDGDVHKDYGESKLVPVMFTGSMISLYPWRQKIYKIVTKNYPSLTFPHLGYETHSPLMIHGEQYARIINASWFVPTCGTVVKEVVRKHFEVPGCNTCLITEESPSLKAAGFVDMENCVFTDEIGVLDKLDYLFNNKNKLVDITNRGFELVHSRHTLKHRDQILQWFNLFKKLKPNEKIVQISPFEQLSIVNKSSVKKHNYITCNGLHLEFFRKGNRRFLAGEYDEAEELYLKCLDYIPTMSEPKIKLGICNLYKGDVQNAFQWIIQPIQFNLGLYQAQDSDPVEWAYYIITLLCQGKLNEAIIRANQFPFLNHIELFRTRWAVECLNNNGEVDLLSDDELCDSRYSIHQIPPTSFFDWISNLCIMLRACKQFSYADSLNDRIKLKKVPINAQNGNMIIFMKWRRYLLAIRIWYIEELNQIFDALHVPVGKKGLPSIYIYDFIFRILKWLKMSVVKRL